MKEFTFRIMPSHHEPSEPRSLSRRGMIQRLFGTTVTGLALPGLAVTHPVYRHVTSSSTMAAAEAKAADPGWAPVFFDDHQNETLIVLAECIVPNSTRAQVNRFVDTMLSVDTLENQKKFLAALGEFDHEATARYSHSFKGLSEEQQNTILIEASTAKPSQPGQGVRRRRRPTVVKPASAPPVLTLRDHFDIIKGWVSGAFYSSEFGMKELGWTGQVAWDSLPGCPHPGGHG